MPEPYDIGDDVRVWRRFYDANGALSDPDTITLTIKPPSLSAQVYSYPGTITRLSQGYYEQIITLMESGTTQARWATTGNPTVGEPDHWDVRHNAF